MKKPRAKKKTIAEKEASLFDNAKLSKEAFNRGYDLGTTGTIKSLLNFIATATIKPATKKGKTGRHLKFNETADIWMNELDKDCKDPFTASYYEGWDKKRDFACQTDILENNHPDYKVLGGKVSVHGTVKKKYKNIANTVDIDDVKEKFGYGEGYYEYMANQLENIETGKPYNLNNLNYWIKESINIIDKNKKELIENKNKLSLEKSKKKIENIEDKIYGNEFDINKYINLHNKIKYIKDKLYYSNEFWENYGKENSKFWSKVQPDFSKNYMMTDREKLNLDNLNDSIKIFQYDYYLHKAKDEIENEEMPF